MVASRWSVVVAAALAACAQGSGTIRYGSLTQEERSLDYSHGVRTQTLANGLRVALIRDDRADLVAVDVRYAAGHFDDPDGQRGLAHLVEHMMFERRERPAEPTVSEALGQIALRFNAWTGWDATHYHTVGLAGALEPLLAIEAARMRDPCGGIGEAAFARERSVVMQELAQRGAPHGFNAQLAAVYGASHSYGKLATPEDVAGLSLENVCRFVATHYAPDRAILVVAGRFDPAAVARALELQFAPIDRHASPDRPAPARALTGGSDERRLSVTQPTAVVLLPAAAWGSDEAFDDRIADQLVLLELAQSKGRAAWITAVDYDQLPLAGRNGFRAFRVTVSDPARLGDAVDAIYAAADALPTFGTWRVAEAIASLRETELITGFASLDELGERCSDYLQYVGDEDFHLRELAMLEHPDPERIAARIRRIQRNQSRVLRLVPSGEPAALAQLASAAIDAPTWRAPVDPADATRPLAFQPGPARAAVTDTRLGNGMRLVMVNDFTEPVIQARLVFPVGKLDAGPAGVATALSAADLLNHDGERKYRGQDRRVVWALRLGTQLSASVQDHTTFAASGTAIFADWHVWRLHWLLENGTYAAEAIAAARAAASKPQAPGDHTRSWRRAFQLARFGEGHPYTEAIDVERGVRQLDLDALDAFRAAHYRAPGATLIVVGRFDAAVMARTVGELFGAWPATPPVPPVAAVPIRPANGPLAIAHRDPDTTQVLTSILFATASPRTSRAQRAIARALIDSRLQDIRQQLGASYGMYARYLTSPAGDTLKIEGRVDAHRAGEVLRRITRDLEGLRSGDDALAADFVRARRAALADALDDPLRVDSVADALEEAVAEGRPLDQPQALPAAIAGTLLADVREVLAADLQRPRMTVLLSGPPADTAAAFAAAGLANVHTVGD